jgi:thiamine-phosphate pyrophosphorylase
VGYSLKNARLLLVTDPRPDLVSRVEAAVRGGVDIVQLRDKTSPRERQLELAGALLEVCNGGGALFTINDNPELARLAGAGGVHLGQEDGPIERARGALGPDAVVGRSAGSVEEARGALEEGADYLGVGTIFATPTKPDAEVAGLRLVKEVAREGLSRGGEPVPWFVIGGISRRTAPAAVEAGAPGLAVVRAVLDADDPEGAARELRSLFDAGPGST